MTYPPDFDENLIYTRILNLDEVPVFMEMSGENPMFLEVTGLPDVLSYGKHYGLISLKFPKNSEFQLADNSELKFEVKDANGVVVFSDLAVSEDTENNYSGASVFYIWIKKDPLRTYTEIQDEFSLLYTSYCHGRQAREGHRQFLFVVVPVLQITCEVIGVGLHVEMTMPAEIEEDGFAFTLTFTA